MPSVNKIVLIGQVNEAPQIRETDGGNVVSRFVISVERVAKPNTPSKVDEIQVVAWGDLASQSQSVAQPGQTILIEGRISVRSFNDSDGQRKWTTEVEARQLRPFGRGTEAQNVAQPSAPSYHLEEKPGSTLATSDFDFSEPSVASVPFGNGSNEEVPF